MGWNVSTPIQMPLLAGLKAVGNLHLKLVHGQFDLLTGVEKVSTRDAVLGRIHDRNRKLVAIIPLKSVASSEVMLHDRRGEDVNRRISWLYGLLAVAVAKTPSGVG